MTASETPFDSIAEAVVEVVTDAGRIRLAEVVLRLGWPREIVEPAVARAIRAGRLVRRQSVLRPAPPTDPPAAPATRPRRPPMTASIETRLVVMAARLAATVARDGPGGTGAVIRRAGLSETSPDATEALAVAEARGWVLVDRGLVALGSSCPPVEFLTALAAGDRFAIEVALLDPPDLDLDP